MLHSSEPCELAKMSGWAYGVAEYAERQLASFHASVRAFADNAIHRLVRYERNGGQRKQYSTAMLPAALLKNSFEFRYNGVTILYSVPSSKVISIDHIDFDSLPPGGTPVSARPSSSFCKETLETVAVSTTKLRKIDTDRKDDIHLEIDDTPRVLAIGDDVLSVLVNALGSTGAVVEQVESGEEALEMLRHYNFDVVVVDLTLAGMEGYEVVSLMRAAPIETPVLMLSVLAPPIDADDFIAKLHAECVAPMQTAVRWTKGFSLSALRDCLLQLSLDIRSVTMAGRPMHLSERECAILERLVGSEQLGEPWLSIDGSTYGYAGLDIGPLDMLPSFVHGSVQPNLGFGAYVVRAGKSCAGTGDKLCDLAHKAHDAAGNFAVAGRSILLNRCVARYDDGSVLGVRNRAAYSGGGDWVDAGNRFIEDAIAPRSTVCPDSDMRSNQTAAMFANAAGMAVQARAPDCRSLKFKRSRGLPEWFGSGSWPTEHPDLPESPMNRSVIRHGPNGIGMIE